MHATTFASSLMRGVSGDDPEGGAGSGVLRRVARNRPPREAGAPPPRHYHLGARSSLHGSARHPPPAVGRRGPKETETRPPEPPIPTPQGPDASVPPPHRVP